MDIAGYIDSTDLRADASNADIDKLCNEAVKNKLAAICINSYHLPQAKRILFTSQVKLCTVISFPLGANAINEKIKLAELALQEGAEELDIVINIAALKEKNYNLLKNEFNTLLKIKETYPYVLKIIVETALLSIEELASITQLISETKVDYIKTSTGFSSRGVSLEDIKIIQENKAKELMVKASGGIKEYDFALELIKAGVSRIGSSSALKIIQEQVQRVKADAISN